MDPASDAKVDAHASARDTSPQTHAVEGVVKSTPSTSSKEGSSGLAPGDGGVEKVNDEAEEKVSYGWRFWAIFPALCLTGFLSSMEGTVITTALPSISSDLGLNDNFVWVANGFFLAG